MSEQCTEHTESVSIQNPTQRNRNSFQHHHHQNHYHHQSKFSLFKLEVTNRNTKLPYISFFFSNNIAENRALLQPFSKRQNHHTKYTYTAAPPPPILKLPTNQPNQTTTNELQITPKTNHRGAFTLLQKGMII